MELHFKREAVVTEILSMKVISEQRPEGRRGPYVLLHHYIFKKQMQEV